VEVADCREACRRAVTGACQKGAEPQLRFPAGAHNVRKLPSDIHGKHAVFGPVASA
jgi:hypothetical protein